MPCYRFSIDLFFMQTHGTRIRLPAGDVSVYTAVRRTMDE